MKVLTDRYPEIEKVVLFGSLARNDAVPGSDADLLLVLRESDLPFWERSVRYRPTSAGIGVDVFAYTQAELDSAVEAGSPFLLRAFREGIILSSEDS